MDNEREADANPVGVSDQRKSREKFFIKSRPVWDWKEVYPGQMVYLKYYGLWHAVLVTGYNRQKGTIRGIHYGWKGIITREVTEEDFKVNMQKNKLWEVHIPEGRRRSNVDAVNVAKQMIGEKKFNMFTRRSRHMVFDCVLDN